MKAIEYGHSTEEEKAFDENQGEDIIAQDNNGDNDDKEEEEDFDDEFNSDIDDADVERIRAKM